MVQLESCQPTSLMADSNSRNLAHFEQYFHSSVALEDLFDCGDPIIKSFEIKAPTTVEEQLLPLKDWEDFITTNDEQLQSMYGLFHLVSSTLRNCGTGNHGDLILNLQKILQNHPLYKAEITSKLLQAAIANLQVRESAEIKSMVQKSCEYFPHTKWQKSTEAGGVDFCRLDYESIKASCLSAANWKVTSEGRCTTAEHHFNEAYSSEVNQIMEERCQSKNGILKTNDRNEKTCDADIKDEGDDQGDGDDQGEGEGDDEDEDEDEGKNENPNNDDTEDNERRNQNQNQKSTSLALAEAKQHNAASNTKDSDPLISISRKTIQNEIMCKNNPTKLTFWYPEASFCGHADADPKLLATIVLNHYEQHKINNNGINLKKGRGFWGKLSRKKKSISKSKSISARNKPRPRSQFLDFKKIRESMKKRFDKLDRFRKSLNNKINENLKKARTSINKKIPKGMSKKWNRLTKTQRNVLRGLTTAAMIASTGALIAALINQNKKRKLKKESKEGEAITQSCSGSGGGRRVEKCFGEAIGMIAKESSDINNDTTIMSCTDPRYTISHIQQVEPSWIFTGGSTYNFNPKILQNGMNSDFAREYCKDLADLGILCTNFPDPCGKGETIGWCKQSQELHPRRLILFEQGICLKNLKLREKERALSTIESFEIL